MFSFADHEEAPNSCLHENYQCYIAMPYIVIWPIHRVIFHVYDSWFYNWYWLWWIGNARYYYDLLSNVNPCFEVLFFEDKVTTS